MLFFRFQKKHCLKTLERLLERTFQLLVVLIPTQLSLHLWPNWSHLYGIRIDYLAPTLYLSDILIFLVLLLWLVINQIKNPLLASIFKPTRKTIVYCLILLFVIGNIVVAQQPFPALLKWLKLAELVLLTVFVVRYLKFDIQRWIVLPLTVSVILFVGIGIAQFINQQTLNGLFYFLGERNFSVNTPAIATVNLLGQEYLRSYSTFPHPNALAGYLGVCFIFLLTVLTSKHLGQPLSKKLIIGGLLLLFIGLVLTFSRMAFLALLACLVFYVTDRLVGHKFLLKQHFLYLVLIIGVSILSLTFKTENLSWEFIYQQSVSERINLLELSAAMFRAKPIFGVGLNNFILNIPEFSNNSFWVFQPVHNIFLLILNEAGLIGLTILIWGWHCLNKKAVISSGLIYILIFIGLTGLVDHYWFTLQQNLILSALTTGIIIRKSR